MQITNIVYADNLRTFQETKMTNYNQYCLNFNFIRSIIQLVINATLKSFDVEWHARKINIKF